MSGFEGKDRRAGAGMDRLETDRLIALIARDARLRGRFGASLLAAAALGVATAAAAFLSILHPRHDLAIAAETARFGFKFAVTIPLAVVAIGLIDRLARPAAQAGPWPWLLLGTLLILAAGIAAELSAAPQAEWGTRLVGTNARYCLLFIPLIAAGPLACLIGVLRRGAPSRPGLAGAVAGLAASGIAAAFYALHCPDDSPLFVATWYTLATGLVAACGFLSGRRFLGT